MTAILQSRPEARGQTTLAEKPKRLVCRHCGVPSPAGEFCCAGCAYVYRLVHEEGLQAYYQLRDTVIAPADAALLPARDFGWLVATQDEAEAAAEKSAPELRLDVQGISCAGCVWLIERLFQKQAGAGRIDINAQTGQMRMTWVRGEFDATAFARMLQSFNYLVSPASAQRSTPPESRALVKRIGLCTAFAMNVMLFTLPTYFGMDAMYAYARLFGTLSMAFGTLSLLAGGGYFLKRAAGSLRAGLMSIDVPIALGILGAYSGSFFGWITGAEVYVYFDFVSSFILLMLIGRWAQVAAVERNQRRLLAQQPTPPRVRVWDTSGMVCECAPEAIKAGQRFEIGPGQTVPVEAKLRTVEAAMNLAWINGEAEPRLFRAGQTVPAGATNVTRGHIQFDATQAWSASMLAELLKPADRSTYRHRFIERVIQGYLIAIIVIATLAGLGWWLATGDIFHAGAVVTAVLVVSCPCAIGLAFPLADEMATVALRKRGVFVRTGDLWARLAKVTKLAFDKTGTLTLEAPVLLNADALHTLSLEGKKALLALIEDNPHPVARCLYEHFLAAGGALATVGTIQEEVGWGMTLHADGVCWTLGRPGWQRKAAASGVMRESTADVEFCREGIPLACFHFSEEARPDARAEVAALKKRELEITVLSGDHREKVIKLVESLGLSATQALAGLTPREKAEWLDRNGAEETLMLGDGANDSLAFDRALCRGTPVIHRGVLEQKADFYYLGRGIAGIRALFEVNDARRRTHAWLLAFSIAYNLLAIGLAVSGNMHPLLAAILMPVSSLLTLAIVGAGMCSVFARK